MGQIPRSTERISSFVISLSVIRKFQNFTTHRFINVIDIAYTLNHTKRDILFFTITLANINRFLQFLYHFNLEEILHATVVKFTTSP